MDLAVSLVPSQFTTTGAQVATDLWWDRPSLWKWLMVGMDGPKDLYKDIEEVVDRRGTIENRVP